MVDPVAIRILFSPAKTKRLYAHFKKAEVRTPEEFVLKAIQDDLGKCKFTYDPQCVTAIAERTAIGIQSVKVIFSEDAAGIANLQKRFEGGGNWLHRAVESYMDHLARQPSRSPMVYRPFKGPQPYGLHHGLRLFP